MKDYMIRGIGKGSNIRFFVGVTTNLCDEARARHDSYPTATAAMGRLLTAGLLMGSNLKNEELITLRIEGDGPLGTILATADGNGHVKGYVANPHTHLPAKRPGKLDVGGAVGSGTFNITRDLGMKDKYNSSTPLVSGEIGEDIASYYGKSEQIPTAVGLGVLVEPDNSVSAAGGYIVQGLPGVTDEELIQLEENVSKMEPVSTLIHNGCTPEEIASMLLGGNDVMVLESMDLSFQCNCSKDRFKWILESLSKDDLQDLLLSEDGVEINCHYCGEKYHFTQDELNSLSK